MAEPASEQLLALKFELALAVGQSLDLAPMGRRFLVTLLNATGGSSAQLWLRAEAEAGALTPAAPLRVAYPQRSLEQLARTPALDAWMRNTASGPAGMPAQRSHVGGCMHALPVDAEGWLFIDQASGPLPEAVLQAIAVVLKRLAHACRACHEHARARGLLAQKAVAKAALREALARKDEILSLSADGFATARRDGGLIFTSPRLGELVHRLPSTGVPTTLAEVDATLHEAGAPGARLHEQAQTLRPDASLHGTLTLTQPTHRDLHWTLRATPDGERCVLFLRDISRETELDRMKSQFLATAAHELRTPLASVYGYAELLLTRPGMPAPQQRELMGIVHRQSQVLMQLINQLLDVARLESAEGMALELKAMPLAEAVGTAVDACRLQGQERQVEVTLGPNASALQADPDKFRRVLINLLNNAFKYSQDNSRVRVQTAACTLQGRPAVAVAVADEGIGMTAEQCRRVFERFYRADPSGHVPGTGLGMSIVKQIVDLHGGEVEVSSHPGQGTTVTTRWPLAWR